MMMMMMKKEEEEEEEEEVMALQCLHVTFRILYTSGTLNNIFRNLCPTVIYYATFSHILY